MSVRYGFQTPNQCDFLATPQLGPRPGRQCKQSRDCRRRRYPRQQALTTELAMKKTYISQAYALSISITIPKAPQLHLPLIFLFQMIQICCNVVPINNFQRQSCSFECLEGNRENVFENVRCLYLRFLQRFRCTLAMALCSRRCRPIFKTAALICTYDAVGKLIKRFNWRQVYLAKRRNKN